MLLLVVDLARLVSVNEAFDVRIDCIKMVGLNAPLALQRSGSGVDDAEHLATHLEAVVLLEERGANRRSLEHDGVLS